MLVASRRIGLLDRYRVPYRIDPSTGSDGLVRIARADGEGCELVSVPGADGGRHERFVLDGAVLHAPVADAQAAAPAIANRHGWTDETPIVDSLGVTRSAIGRAADGSILVPFDLDAPLQALLDERYVEDHGRLRQLTRSGYYRARRLMPRTLQMMLRRRYRAIQERAPFPAWPTETSLHRLESLILRLIEDVAGEPLPWIWHWPGSHAWALVLTHDVERADGYARVPALQELEAKHGLRSAWYFVPERDYRVEQQLLERLRDAGAEIGLHGLHHDGRDLAPQAFHRRLGAMRRYAEQWGAVGFRSPSTHRDAVLIAELGVDHDSSWSDVATYEPEPGGCCSWLPYFIGDVVELPITLPQDHTLFDLRGELSDRRWLDKTAFLREEGGMALMLTHPDYLVSDERLAVYERFLSVQAADDSSWKALPGEVAGWWRRRAASTPERVDGSWTIAGPAAADGRVALGAPSPPRVSRTSSD